MRSTGVERDALIVREETVYLQKRSTAAEFGRARTVDLKKNRWEVHRFVPKGARPARRCSIAARLPAATHDTVGVSTVKATRPYGEKARGSAGTPSSLARRGAFDFSFASRGCRLC